MSSRRQAVMSVVPGPGSNAGLWLDRWLRDSGEKGAGKQEHLLVAVDTVRVPEAYSRWYARWRQMVAGCPPATVMAEVEVEGRMAIGLGAESVLETAITLDRCFGVPCLPGPALKGLAAAAARRGPAEAWRPGKAGTEMAYRTVFGDTESSGYVTFHDGVWIPEGDRLPLDLDVMTVHHSKYYQDGTAPPAEWDDPNPVSFLSARGKYLLALSGPQRWAERALEILVGALAGDGIGAKTAAGYGRMKVVGGAAPGLEGTVPRKHLPPWQPRAAAVNLGNAGHYVPQLLQEYTGEDRRALVQAIIEKLTRRTCREALRKEKVWARLLLEAEGTGEESS
jgi:CRISPR-associated protein Cmr6